MKPDSSPISSQAMINRMTELIAGEAEPETETDRIWMQEMNEILAAGGMISVPTDLPDPMSTAEAAWHLSPDEELVRSKSAVRRVRFDWYGRDGDLDGDVQDGTPFQRRSRSNSHNAIGKRRRKLIQRLRLRDMPFPFNPVAPPANMPPAAAARPEEKSLMSIGRRIGRARRAARFNPDAIDGNSDGTVQDGTEFERPTPPRKGVARRVNIQPVFGPSGNPKKKSVKKKDPVEPFKAIGRRDTVRPPRDLGTESRLQAVVPALKKFDFSTVSEFLRTYGPFGGHRSKQDGPHPAAKAVVDAMHAKADAKYGPLDSIEQMENALKKAFPNADIGIRHAVDVGGRFTAISASESFKIEEYDHVKKIVAEFKVSKEEATRMYHKVTQSYTRTMLALADEHPEMTKSLTYIGGMPYDPDSPALAFVSGDQRKPGSFVMAFSPVFSLRMADVDPDQTELSQHDFYMLSIASGLKKAKTAELGASSISSIVSDSDLDTLVAATMIHEFGHLAGDHIIVQDTLVKLGGVAGMENILFGQLDMNLDLSTIVDPEVVDVADEFRAYGDEYFSTLEKSSLKLAKNPVDLKKRLLLMGLVPPANLEKLPLEERVKWAEKVMRAALVATAITEIAFMIGDGDQRLMDNLAIRALGTYGLTNIEEAAAEIFLATKFGLRLEDMVDVSKDPYIEQRVNHK